MTILVTGASGLIGFRLCNKLAAEGAGVVALTSNSRRASVLRPSSSIRVVGCDIRDHDGLNQILGTYQFDTVFHLAAHLPSTPDPDFVRVNAMGTANLLNTCYRTGVKNFIYASSMSVYSTPPVLLPVDEMHPTIPDSVYGKTKLTGERLCKHYSWLMRAVTIRFSSVFGPGDNSRVTYCFTQAALSNQAIQVDGDGSQSSDFIYVDDAVQGAILAMEHGRSGGVYNIGSGRETSVLKLAYLAAGLVDPHVEVRLSGRLATRPFRFVADIEKARRELGYSPSDLVEGMKKYREEMKG